MLRRSDWPARSLVVRIAAVRAWSGRGSSCSCRGSEGGRVRPKVTKDPIHSHVVREDVAPAATDTQRR